MSITFKDVAKLAGVSTQTVSRVTNGSQDVAESTRNKVNAAIKQLGYVPNKGAQMLSRAKSTSVGLVTLDMALHGAAMIANGVRMQAHDMSYGVAFSVVAEPNLANTREAIRELMAQQVDSIILNVPLKSADAELLVEQYQHLNLIFIDVPSNSQVNYVCGDHAEGAKLAAQHLLESGRTDFLLITGPNESSASKIRHQSWLAALSDAESKVQYQYQGNWQAESGYLGVREAVAKQAVFDAVLVASDQMALGAFRALQELQIPVPDKVAVVGFDGIEDSAFFNPPLTTIKQDFTTIGRQAVILAEKLNANSQDALLQQHIETALLPRESSQPKLTAHYEKQEIEQLLKRIQTLLPESK
ncbi:LacI family transcriptional regulator [Vibrio splendidus]|uniref:LacI family DNA-binding transcriptional regulator n=1 Tax=Vibrio lentus TaxID=136468 RepID=A0A4U2BC67_9VIBR|nr:LacI family DNA-binding transcriptional regulator [Vibrio lentus]PHN86872.1 LacI family transcriptional regulator [Vibrio splendidus]PML10793.1 LacI family transcriptional regulator [Vibrio lentus]TKF59515.1 LacI family DNA-binding transcriptional regulator [Vibrio lentus]TKF94263.1 LacI family DNA-binding transcriptional regulator [Vibrio lentus]TKG06574.1 LacI family DNA-binding transcriptional regulator [Vibrio lentus]